MQHLIFLLSLTIFEAKKVTRFFEENSVKNLSVIVRTTKTRLSNSKKQQTEAQNNTFCLVTKYLLPRHSIPLASQNNTSCKLTLTILPCKKNGFRAAIQTTLCDTAIYAKCP